MSNVILVSSHNLTVLVGMLETKNVCLLPLWNHLKWVKKLFQVGLQYWIKNCSSKFKLHPDVRWQKFMNSYRKCVVTQHQITAQFYLGPKGFIKVTTVLKTWNTPVGWKLTTHQQPLLLPLWKKTDIWLGTMTQKLCTRNHTQKTISEPGAVGSWSVGTQYDNTRPHVTHNKKTVLIN